MVGVFNASPVYVMGLSGLLSSCGYTLEPVTDPVGWLRHHRGAAVLVGVDDEADLDVVVALKAEEPNSVVVTLIDEVSVAAFQASLSAGATGSIGRDAGATQVLLAFNAAMTDNVVIPAAVARSLAASNCKSEAPSRIDQRELFWLKALASGETVAELCDRIGYSEREMYRRLRRLYSKIGASNRTDALLKATRYGWLE
jgi:DNA-binding NarL/FixJ family response regulator